MSQPNDPSNPFARPGGPGAPSPYGAPHGSQQSGPAYGPQGQNQGYQQPVQPSYGQPQGGYQQPGFGPGAPQGSFYAPPKPPGKAPKILTIVGIALMVIGVLLAGLFALQFTSLIPDGDEIVPVSGTTDVTISDGKMKVIYASDRSVNCGVTGPGEAQPNVFLGVEMTFTNDGTTYTAIGKIGGDGEPDGAYTLDCDGPGVIVAPPLSVAGVVGAVVLAFAGLGLFVLGLILLVVGLVLRAAQKRSAPRVG